MNSLARVVQEKTVKMSLACALFLSVVCPLAARGSSIPVVSYSMFNGGTGAFNYMDSTYSNCVSNNCNTTGALLSGGTGQLTNGILPVTDWTAGNPEPWVGWAPNQPNGLNPLVTFYFNGTPTINSVTVWFDNTLGSGSVGAPASISVNGTNYTGIPQNIFGPQAFTISGLNITNNSINVQFFQTPSDWTMIGQVSFNGTTTTAPEPSSIMLLGTGLLGLMGMVLYRKRLAL